MTVDDLSCVRGVIRLFDALATPVKGMATGLPDERAVVTELWFLFAMIWGLGGSLAEDGRIRCVTSVTG